MVRKIKHKKLTALFLALVMVAGLVTVALASDWTCAVVDTTDPTGSVTLAPGDSAPITINLTVTGRQEGTATFKVYRNWTLSGSVFTGSNPQEFTVPPRAAGDAATTFSTSGTVIVAAGQADGTFTLAVGVFDITNSNSTGAKLEDGTPSNYQVIVESPASSDTTPPVLTLPGNMIVEATGPAGAIVEFTATATDDVDGPVPVTCTPASGSTFPLGTTTVNCSATDAAGNEATGSFTVTVEDTTPPTLTLPSDITVEATSSTGAVVTFTATASDIVDGSVALTCNPASGSTFPLGTTTVNCSATDAAGNEATGSFTVTVRYGWSGFFQPVDNLPTLNAVKAGSAVPVKFSLNGDMGLNIFAVGFPKSVQIVDDGSMPVDTIETTVTAGNSSLSYNSVTDQYNYVWKTDKAWAGTSRQLQVKLNDDTIHVANFKLLK